MSCGGKWFIRNSFFTKVRRMLWIGSGGMVFFCGINIATGNEKFYTQWINPTLHKLDPETAHNLAITFIKFCPFYYPKYKDSDMLRTKVWGIEFSNPIGIGAGFDKHGEAIEGLKKIGFGFVEIGSVTPLPQPGNEKPRVFRLPDDLAVINRYGFNSCGFESVKKRLLRVSSDTIVGVNLGKNKVSVNPIQDYTLGVEMLGKLASYLVINISSPNTAGLRDLQNEENLPELLKAVMSSRDTHSPGVPVLVKLSPDFPIYLRKSLASILVRSKVDGLIISNTTTSRPPDLIGEAKTEVGGLSGRPLKTLSNQMIKEMYTYTGGQIPIIGVGGVGTGCDAYEKLKLGASLIQIYTSFIYNGPPIVSKIKEELEELLKSDGYASIEEIIGINNKSDASIISGC